MDPSIARYHGLHGGVLALQAKFIEAEPHYRASINLARPEDDEAAWLLYEYADYLYAIGLTGQAIRYCRTALELSPDYISARCLMSNCLMDTGEQEEAEKQAELVFKAISETATPSWSRTGHYLAGYVCRRFGEIELAIDVLTKGSKIGRPNLLQGYEIHSQRALCYLRVNKREQARKDFLVALSASSGLVSRCSTNFDAIYCLAFSRLALGDAKKAKQLVKRALGVCSLDGVIKTWAEQAQYLAIANPALIGVAEFLDSLENPDMVLDRPLGLSLWLPAQLKGFGLRRSFSLKEQFNKLEDTRGRLKQEEKLEALEEMRNQAIALQERLKKIETVYEKNGIKVKVNGAQQVIYLEFNGEKRERIVEAINTAMKGVQKRAAKAMIEMIEMGGSEVLDNILDFD